MLNCKLHRSGLNMARELVSKLLDQSPLLLKELIRVRDASDVQIRECRLCFFEFVCHSHGGQATSKFNQGSKRPSQEIADAVIQAGFAQLNHTSVKTAKFAHLKTKVFIEDREARYPVQEFRLTTPENPSQLADTSDCHVISVLQWALCRGVFRLRRSGQSRVINCRSSAQAVASVRKRDYSRSHET
jgi:hypothetical protein